MWETNNSIDDSKEGWLYLTVETLSAWLHGINSKHNSDFYYLNGLHSFRTENNLKSHGKVCKNKDFCGNVIRSEKGNIIEFNQYMKSDKMQYFSYADLESLIKKLRWMYKQSRNFFSSKNRWE